MAAAAATLDGIIDTVSGAHDVNALLGLLKPHGKLVLVGIGELPKLNHWELILRWAARGAGLLGSNRGGQLSDD